MSSEQTSRQPEPLANVPVEENWAILALVWRRKLIVLLVAIMGLGLGYLFFLQQMPVYRSSAQILIIKESVKLPLDGMEFSNGYDDTHQTVIRSPLVIKSAVSKPEIVALASLRGAADLPGRVSKVMSGLKATGGGSQSGDIIKLDYESPSREDCPKVLQAVVDAYEQFLGATRKKESDDTVVLISQAKDELGKQITDLKERYHRFRSTSPLFVTGPVSQTVNETWLQKIDETRSDAVLNNSQLQAQIKAIEDALKRGSSRESLNLMVGKLTQPGEAGAAEISPRQTLEERLFPLLIQEQELLEKNNYGPDHPQVKMIRKTIELTRELLVEAERREGVKAKPKATADYYEIYLGSLREKFRMNEQIIASMTELLKNEQEASRRLTSAKVEDENFRSEITLKERLFEAVLKRLEEITLAKNTAGVRVEQIYPPSGGIQVRPDLATIMGVAGVLGLMSGFGLAYLIDSADRRFRSPEEIRTDFGLPVFGHIPVISAAVKKRRGRGKREIVEAGKLSDALSVYHQPKGRIAEAYRGVRTALFFSTRISGHKVFQVTSPSPGDGKTTSICNLAVSIADAGKKVVLIDADFRRPRVHHLFGIKTDIGMSSVIEGTVELADAVQETPIPNLSVLPCGPRPENPAELLTSRRFEELLDILREKYEYVLIDSPPVLAVTDPLNVAARVDGMLLVMRLTKTARHNGRRALDAIEAIGANILGVVVNGVGKTGGYGYGYESYGRYGSSYSFGGRYGADYRYGYGDDKTYYADEDSESKVEPTARSRGNGREVRG